MCDVHVNGSCLLIQAPPCVPCKRPPPALAAPFPARVVALYLATATRCATRSNLIRHRVDREFGARQ